MTNVLQLSGVKQGYGTHPVIEDLSLALGKGSIGCLLGPSGCGKTTILRCVAGFEPVASGEIRINGEIVSSAGVHVPTERRNVGIVFQDYALFPHLDVEANVAFGLRRRPASERSRRVAQMLDVVGLQALRKRFPHQLSGGQQQRVALARALAPQPDLLLLDEPFSNLDVDLRERLSLEVRDILKQQGSTALMVTHDQHEAFAMADEIGIMLSGCIQQWDSANNLYHKPGNRMIADFIGQGAFLAATADAEGRMATELGTCAAIDPGAKPAAIGQIEILLRPEDVEQDDSSPVKAQILHKAFRGAEILYALKLPSGSRILCLASSQNDRPVGERVGVRLRDGRISAFFPK